MLRKRQDRKVWVSGNARSSRRKFKNGNSTPASSLTSNSVGCFTIKGGESKQNEHEDSQTSKRLSFASLRQHHGASSSSSSSDTESSSSKSFYSSDSFSDVSDVGEYILGEDELRRDESQWRLDLNEKEACAFQYLFQNGDFGDECREWHEDTDPGTFVHFASLHELGLYTTMNDNDNEGVCADCCSVLKTLAELLESAENSVLELSRLKRQHIYCYPRLKKLLAQHAFDIHGNYLIHHACLQNKLKVSNGFLAGARKCAKSQSSSESLSKSKASVVSLQLCDRVIVPSKFKGTQKQYLASLGDDEIVKLAASSHDSPHRLSQRTGEKANRYMTAVRSLFRKFIRRKRSPTGRTEDECGRCHGAKYYLDSQFLQLQKVDACASRKFRNNRPDFNILTSVFRDELKSLDSQLEINLIIPSHRAIADWFREDFSSTSTTFEDGTEAGHTVIHPQSKDACSQCCKLKTDMNSVQASISRHKHHKEKQGLLKKLIAKLAGLQDKQLAHREEASAAKETYRSVTEVANENYRAVFLMWEELRRNHSDDSDFYDSDKARDALKEFISRAARLLFVMEHDYQENKNIPSWNASPQPGPVYFMSSRVFYVHVIVSPSLGLSQGESKYGRNVVYTRDEIITTRKVKVGKYSDDTLSTVFHFFSGSPTTGYEPSIFRTGYDINGKI